VIDAVRRERAAKALRACMLPDVPGPVLERDWDLMSNDQRRVWLRTVDAVVATRAAVEAGGERAAGAGF
jgi:hypothetical protein